MSDDNTAEVLNTFFSNIVSNLKIEGHSNCDPLANNIKDPVLKCIVKYRNHPSILAIGEVYNKNRRLPFSFSKIKRDEILSDILKLETFEACQETDIPTKIVKANADIFANVLVSNFNDSIEKSNFPSILKNATITPVFKKGGRDSKDNYRPVSILPNISKIFERCIFHQLSNFMDQFLLKYEYDFRKGYSTQYCLSAMLGKWKSAVDKGKSFGALLTDLSKAFNCLSHELLVAKLHAYGFSIAALRLIHSYLTNRWQRTKINMSYSSWEEIIFGVPQGSILRPLLFNFFLRDLFFIMKETDFSSYADNTPYRTADTIEEVIKLLERDSTMLFKWFSENQMKANISKCHLLVNKKNEVVINLGETEIKNSEYEKLLGIKVDTKLNFNEHLNDIISKASRKVNALSRVVPYMSRSKKKILMNSFFNSQFSYCPLIWMFHSRITNNKINRLHERCMRLIYGDKTSSFEELLEQDKSVSIHTRNLKLATEMFKVYRSMSPPIFRELFRGRDIPVLL